MDRDRLKEVHQTDLTESRINEDFVEWLRTKFWTWLLFALVAVAGWLGWIRWQEYRTNYRSVAWAALAEAELPLSYEDVAEEYANVPGLPLTARRLAAEALLRAVQTGRTLDSDVSEPVKITAEQRDEYLARADRLYREIADADDGTLSMTLHAFGAYTGRAVIAESLGNRDEARSYFERAADRVEDFYPQLAARTRRRAESVTTYEDVSLPSDDDVPSTLPGDEGLKPATIPFPLRRIVLPSPFGP